MIFVLHPNLIKKEFIIDFPLCTILLEDNRDYPWIFLVPRREKISKIMDLHYQDQLLLLKELDIAQKVLYNEFKPKQLNVAAIGNKTDQLHIHVIARFKKDPSWPNTVWDRPAIPYEPKEKKLIVAKLHTHFALYQNTI